MAEQLMTHVIKNMIEYVENVRGVRRNNLTLYVRPEVKERMRSEFREMFWVPTADAPYLPSMFGVDLVIITGTEAHQYEAIVGENDSFWCMALTSGLTLVECPYGIGRV